MSPDPQKGTRSKADESSSDEEKQAILELRQLILGDDANRPGKSGPPADPKDYAEEVARVLPHAIRLRNKTDHHVSQALAPAIEETLHISVRKNPEQIVEALSPVMMPAIRKSIADTVRSMIQGFNTTLENSLSWKGLQWRVEAFRTGRPFAEVALMRSLLYRVEQVFLIHAETGLLLSHVSTEEGIQDADIVSGMFTAIQEFVRDSFGAGSEECLDSLQVGKFTIWIERGRSAMMAVVYSGRAPLSLRELMQDGLNRIHVELAGELSAFEGDPSLFEAAVPELEKCCIAARVEPKRRLSFGVGFFFLLNVSVLLLVVWIVFSAVENARWSRYVETLRGEAGIIVVSEGKRDGKFFIRGLRDRLSRAPQSFLREFDFESSEVTESWENYLSLDPTFVLRRAVKILVPPSSVTLSVNEETLVCTGEAAKEWVLLAEDLVRNVPGVSGFDTSGLTVHE